MSFGGVVLRFGSLFLRFLQFACAAIGLGFFSYFLSVLADRDLNILNKWKAVEGLTGAAVLYTIFGMALTLCLGGNVFFGYLAVLLDILFVGAFIAVAILTRDGAKSCSGIVNTPLGRGNAADSQGSFGDFGFGSNENATYAVSLGTACRFNKAVFGTAIAAAILFLITAAWQIMMVRHHKKEKAYGPSPSNNYTKGSGKTPFWKRRGNKRANKDMEAAPTGTAVRPSGETGTTVGNNAYGSTEPKFGEPGYGQAGTYHDRTTGNF